MAPRAQEGEIDNGPPPAETHIITVGKVTHRFDAEVVTANIGDTLSFEFFPANHSVIRSTWDNPCIPYERMIPTSQRDIQGPIWSHFNPVAQVVDDADMPWFNITVKTTNPIYIYCAAPGSCNQSGMVMIVNPTSDKNITGFRKNALAAPFQLVPGEPYPTSEGTGTPSKPTPTPSSSSAAPVLPQVTTVTSTPAPSKSSISVGAIAGIAIGGVAALAIVGILVFLLVTRRRSRQVLHLPPTPNNQQPYGYGGTSPAHVPGQPPTQTIIIPMTEAEKMMYLEKLGRGEGVMSPPPMSPDRLGVDPQQQQFNHGTMNSNMTDISRSTTGHGRTNSSNGVQRLPAVDVNANVDPAHWQVYGTLQSPAEIQGPGGHGYPHH